MIQTTRCCRKWARSATTPPVARASLLCVASWSRFLWKLRSVGAGVAARTPTIPPMFWLRCLASLCGRPSPVTYSSFECSCCPVCDHLLLVSVCGVLFDHVDSGSVHSLDDQLSRGTIRATVQQRAISHTGSARQERLVRRRLHAINANMHCLMRDGLAPVALEFLDSLAVADGQHALVKLLPSLFFSNPLNFRRISSFHTFRCSWLKASGLIIFNNQNSAVTWSHFGGPPTLPTRTVCVCSDVLGVFSDERGSGKRRFA